MIKVKRIYDPASPDDGVRFLVDRLWPRGLNKAAVKLDAWLKDFAPSDELRHWYGHDPARWEEFQRRYFAELDEKSMVRQTILPASRRGTVTLLFSSRERERNNAIALKTYLEANLAVKES
jgi:uncharacterized protein YeaO (DUF488 family)